MDNTETTEKYAENDNIADQLSEDELHEFWDDIVRAYWHMPPKEKSKGSDAKHEQQR